MRVDQAGGPSGSPCAVNTTATTVKSLRMAEYRTGGRIPASQP
jgi:hypothetical protein